MAEKSFVTEWRTAGSHAPVKRGRVHAGGRGSLMRHNMRHLTDVATSRRTVRMRMRRDQQHRQRDHDGSDAQRDRAGSEHP